MKVAVLGSGGIGAFLGGGLAKSGNDVTFLARGKHLEAMQNRGLIVESVSLGNFQLKVRATDQPSEVGPVDLVLFCVKAYDTDMVLQEVGPLIRENTTVLCFQNGVDNEDRIAAIVGKQHVLAGAIFIESYIAEPGKIIQAAGPWRIVIGEMDGTITQRAKTIHETLERSGFKCELSDRIQEVLWEKFIFICATAGVCTVSRSSLGEALAFNPTRKLYVSALREIAAVGKANGIKLADDIATKTLERADGVSRTTKPSMLRDLERGKRLEIDTMNGTVSKLGRELSVPTPANDFIFAALKLQDLRVERGSYLS